MVFFVPGQVYIYWFSCSVFLFLVGLQLSCLFKGIQAQLCFIMFLYSTLICLPLFSWVNKPLILHLILIQLVYLNVIFCSYGHLGFCVHIINIHTYYRIISEGQNELCCFSKMVMINLICFS